MDRVFRPEATICRAAGKFGRPSRKAQPPLSEMLYAFHFDAALYARYLRRRAERQGVVRQEGRIVKVHRDGASGDVTSVKEQSPEETKEMIAQAKQRDQDEMVQERLDELAGEEQ